MNEPSAVPTPERKRGRPPGQPPSAIPPNQPKAFPLDGKKLLGLPESAFSTDEQNYINEQMLQYMAILRKTPSARPYVEEAIKAAIDMKRHDLMIATERSRYENGVIPTAKVSWFTKMDQAKTQLMKRYTVALEAIGALPSQTMQQQSQEEQEDGYLTAILERYASEIRARKERGQKIGQPSPEALQIAEEAGLDPSRYKAQHAMPAADREAAITEYEKEKTP